MREKLGRGVGASPSPHNWPATFSLPRHHSRPLCADPTHLLHFVERFAHADQPYAAPCWVENYVRQLSSELLPQLVPHGFLPFHPIRLFDRGDFVPALAVFLLRALFPPTGHQSVQLDHLRA